MTERYDDDVDYEPEPESRRSGSWSTIFIVVALAALGICSALLWRAFGPANFPTFGSANGSPADPADKVPGFRELQALQQQSATQTQAALQLLAAQQAEMKKLSDQMTVLLGKVDALQHPAPVVPPTPPPLAPKPVAQPARKKPAAPLSPPPGASPSAPVQIAPPPPNRP